MTLQGHLNCDGMFTTSQPTETVLFSNVMSKNEEIKRLIQHILTNLPQSEDLSPRTQAHCEMMKGFVLRLCRDLHTFKVQKKK